MFEPAGRLSAKLFNLPNISCICTELLAVVGSLVGWWLVVVGFVFVTLTSEAKTDHDAAVNLDTISIDS